MGQNWFATPVTMALSADLEQPGEGLHATSRWHVLQDPGAHCGCGALHLVAQHNSGGRQALPVCGRVGHSKDCHHPALPRLLDS